MLNSEFARPTKGQNSEYTRSMKVQNS